MQTGRPVLDKEEMETWPDGRVTWVSTTKMPLYDDVRDESWARSASRGDITAEEVEESSDQ